MLSPGEHPCPVEFRHRSWQDDGKKEIDPSAQEVLKERNAATILIDGPGFPVTKEETADHSYIRFHGRNHDIWYTDDKEGDYRINRYDYLYTQEQLTPWKPRIEDVEITKGKVRVYFNNHARAKAIRNAFQLMDMLAIAHKAKEINLQDQSAMGNF
jgi:uncharacterized protein YecE (DUF72 family)